MEVRPRTLGAYCVDVHLSPPCPLLPPCLRSWYQLPWTRAAPYIVGIMLAFAYLRWLSEQIPSPSSSSAGTTGVLEAADPQPPAGRQALKGGMGHSELTEALLGREAAATVAEKPVPAAASDGASPLPSAYDAAVVTSIHVACIAGLSFLFWIPVTYYQTLDPGWAYPANVRPPHPPTLYLPAPPSHPFLPAPPSHPHLPPQSSAHLHGLLQDGVGGAARRPALPVLYR